MPPTRSTPGSGTRVSRRSRSRAGMTDFEPTPGFWGGAQITAADMARFFDRLDQNLRRATPRLRASDLLGDDHRRPSAGEFPRARATAGRSGSRAAGGPAGEARRTRAAQVIPPGGSAASHRTGVEVGARCAHRRGARGGRAAIRGDRGGREPLLASTRHREAAPAPDWTPGREPRGPGVSACLRLVGAVRDHLARRATCRRARALRSLRSPSRRRASHPRHLGAHLLEVASSSSTVSTPARLRPSLGGHLLDPAQPLDVGLGVEPGVLRRALRLDQAARLVHPQRLRVHLGELGGDRDHEDAALLVDRRSARASAYLPVSHRSSAPLGTVIEPRRRAAVDPEAAIRAGSAR